MPDSSELVPTLSDVGRHPEIAMAAYKPEVVITRERHEISARFQRLPHLSYNYVRFRDHHYISSCRSDIGRHRTMLKVAPQVVPDLGESDPTFTTSIGMLSLTRFIDCLGPLFGLLRFVEKWSSQFFWVDISMLIC